jgi:hypothetical protein
MREESRQELGTVEPEYLMKLSEVIYIGRYNGKDVCLWGLIRPALIINQVSLWMLGADGIEDCPKAFLRYTKRYMGLLKTRYDRVTTGVRADFTISRKWVEWLGFKELVYTTLPSHCIYEGQVVVYELEK